MKTAYLQIQLQSVSKEEFMSVLRSIDANAPAPQALEGGDGNGILYLCILDETHLREFISHPKIFCYTEPRPTVVDDALYRPDYYVKWRFGEAPTVSAVDPWA